MSKFELGQLVETTSVSEKRKEDRYFDIFVRHSLSRYQNGDWGDACKEDKRSADYAVKHGERIQAVYIFDVEEIIDYINAVNNEQEWKDRKTSEKNPDGLTIWIITEWDRSVTTILFPEDY